MQIVRAGGEYVWVIKDNQPETCEAIAQFFVPEACVPGFSPASHDDFAAEETVGKAHGRIETRTLTASRALHTWLDWPGVEQVFKLERRFEWVKDRQVTYEVIYGLTSLAISEASPARLLELVRAHWAIENGLHYRRDDILTEDRCTLRTGHAPQAMTVLNNLVLGVVAATWGEKCAGCSPPIQCRFEDSLATDLETPSMTLQQPWVQWNSLLTFFGVVLNWQCPKCLLRQ